MKIIDPGHVYELDHLDGDGTSLLRFVKREGDKYPGNVGHYPGTNMQEVIRALIDRIKYVDSQISSIHNRGVINCLRGAFLELEQRAAERHGRTLSMHAHYNPEPEKIPTCRQCGHIECAGHSK